MNNLTAKTVHISVVSHGQSKLTALLLEDIERFCHGVQLQVTVTLNIPEPLCFEPERFRFPVHLLRNARPQGFSVNHNAAFQHGQRMYPCKYFSVINPDIRFTSDPFTELLSCLEGDHAGVVAPLVLNVEGRIEDSARRFPTPLCIMAKAFGKRCKPDYLIDREIISPDWVAGMFMLFSAKVFQLINGFDERYFLYYEDVDICTRLQLSGWRVLLCPGAAVMHDARRQSHGDIKYLYWHISSMMRYFFSPVFRAVMWRQASGNTHE